MSDWPRVLLDPFPLMHPWCGESIGAELLTQFVNLSAAASAAYPTANRVQYFPFSIQKRLRVATWFWMNGATLGGNVDVGVYDRTLKTRLDHAGSTAQAGASAIQTLAASGLVLEPGAYYLAFVCDLATATFFSRAPSGPGIAAGGVLMLSSAVPLVADASAAVLNTMAYTPVMGFSSRSFV